MTIKVLVVDDSSFFRKRIVDILSKDARLEVVGEAVDGNDAIKKTTSLNPDVITMDVEMPVVDGITAVRRIMKIRPTPILMLSSFTTQGAKLALQALEAGAIDYFPKDSAALVNNYEEVARQIRMRVLGIGFKGVADLAANHKLANNRLSGVIKSNVVGERDNRNRQKFELVAIGSSTGGPIALQQILANLSQDFPLPILVIQHMPQNFTGAFAERLNKLCEVEVKEACSGDEVKPGRVLLAPGGKQMLVMKSNDKLCVILKEPDKEQPYRPSVDVTFNSIAKQVEGNCLAIILTGMGADGCKGARILKDKGSTIWTQDKESSVIYGMPMAVAKAGLSDSEVSLPEIGPALMKVV